MGDRGLCLGDRGEVARGEKEMEEVPRVVTEILRRRGLPGRLPGDCVLRRGAGVIPVADGVRRWQGGVRRTKYMHAYVLWA